MTMLFSSISAREKEKRRDLCFLFLLEATLESPKYQQMQGHTSAKKTKERKLFTVLQVQRKVRTCPNFKYSHHRR